LNKNYVIGILTLIGVLLGAFDVMLIRENKKAEETQNDLNEKIWLFIKLCG